MMIHVNATNKMDLDVCIVIFANYMIYFQRSRFKNL